LSPPIASVYENQQPGEIDIDVDDAQIEEPKGDEGKCCP
jgi:hypothetical protein